MKFSLSILVLGFSVVVQAANPPDFLGAGRSHLKRMRQKRSLCRNECVQENAVAFSVSHDEHVDWCRCYPKVTGRYTGTGEREARKTCYSMVGGKFIFGSGSFSQHFDSLFQRTQKLSFLALTHICVLIMFQKRRRFLIMDTVSLRATATEEG